MTTMTFKKAGLLFLATFVVNIIFASNGFACKRSLEDEGDTYLTSKRPRIEYHQTPFLFSDIMHEIFSFMPFKDTASSRLTCKRWHEVYQSFLQDFVWGNTCNGLGRGLRCQFTISQLPKGHVQKALLDLHAKDGYVSLGLHAFPRSYLPVEFTPIQVGKVKQNIEMTEDFYDTVFSKSLLSHEAQEAALDHLLAACRFYFHQDDRDETIQIFFKNKKGRFIRHLKEQSDIQPYIDFENIPNDLAFISKVHNIVVIDTQLENKGYEKTWLFCASREIPLSIFLKPHQIQL